MSRSPHRLQGIYGDAIVNRGLETEDRTQPEREFGTTVVVGRGVLRKVAMRTDRYGRVAGRMITNDRERQASLIPKLSFVLIVIPAILGCSATYHSIFRNTELTPISSTITTMDAKQRAILHAKMVKGGKDVERFCSEPSPDVFSVVAQALSASGSFGKSADPKSVQAALQAAFSTSEQGSTIPRTQTITMLRELMYRTCERYLNGAYDELEMSIQAIRDQRLMISILAVEQLTGAVTPHPVVIGAGGTSSGGAGGDAIVRFDDAKKAKDAAAENLAAAKLKFDAVNGDDHICDAIATAEKADTDLTDEQKAKKDECDKARKALDAATADDAEQSEHYASLKRLAGTAGVTAGTFLASSAPGGVDRAHSESVATIATTVQKIVDRSFNDDTEVLLFCLKALSDPSVFAGSRASPPQQQSPGGKSVKGTKATVPVQPAAVEGSEAVTGDVEGLRTSCLDYLKTRVNQEKLVLIEKAGLKSEEEASSKALRTLAGDMFKSYWPQLSAVVSNPQKKSAFVVALKTRLLTAEAQKADCFQKATTEAEYENCFLELPTRVQREFGNIIGAK